MNLQSASQARTQRGAVLNLEFSSHASSRVAMTCWFVALCAFHPFSNASDASEAFPAVQLADRIERYAITGSSLDQITSELRAHADSAQSPGNGSTRSEIELTTRLEPQDDVCRIVALVVHLRVTTRLPEWSAADKSSRRVRNAWTKSASMLARHEAGHRTHAIEAADALRQALIDLGPKRDCIRLDMAIGIELHSAVQKLENRALRYDARTQGGLRDDPLGVCCN